MPVYPDRYKASSAAFRSDGGAVESRKAISWDRELARALAQQEQAASGWRGRWRPSVEGARATLGLQEQEQADVVGGREDEPNISPRENVDTAQEVRGLLLRRLGWGGRSDAVS